jgi:hypothetical protein
VSLWSSLALSYILEGTEGSTCKLDSFLSFFSSTTGSPSIESDLGSLEISLKKADRKVE